MRLAKLARSLNATSPSVTNFTLLYSLARQNARKRIPAPNSRLLFMKAKEGRFIKSFDKALPGKHTTALYNGRTKKHSQILCQLRTGICRLNY